jgi:uncharacterized protein YehS (DUF1456 family)
MEASLHELKYTLAAEHERQVRALQQEHEEILSQQVQEFKKRLEDERILLEQQTAEQIAKFEQELTHKMEEKCAQLEKAHVEHVQELSKKNELEIEATRTQLQEKLAAHKDVLQQAHLRVSKGQHSSWGKRLRFTAVLDNAQK